MSKTINLDLVIENMEGEVVTDKKTIKKDGKPVLDKDKQPKTEKVPLTLKHILITLLPVYPDKDKMIDVWDLGLKIRKAEKETEFDNDEFSLIREVIEKNSFPNNIPGGKDTTDRYFPFIIAQVLKYLDEVSVEKGKKVKEDKEEK